MEHSKLHEERLNATFDVTELTILIDGSKENIAKRKQHEKYIFEDERFSEYLAFASGHSLDDICTNSRDVAKYFNAKMAKLGLTSQFIWFLDTTTLFMRCIMFAASTPIGTHESLFVPTVINQSDDEQRQRWLSMINDQKLFGTYVQTELGHGDNVQAIETTATYDRRTKEFIINCPTTTSIKCYAAGVARTSTHAMVMAKLIIDKKNYGLHLFMVQLRNLGDNKPLKGVTLGCMGPKLGLHQLDNGYLHLNNVRIPREDMLMKNAKVLEDGSYVKLSHQYANFASLSRARLTYSGLAWVYLSKAVTIAVRYSSIRQQGTIERGKPEVTIITYQTQQYKLLPQLATSYMFLFALKRMNLIYTNIAQCMEAISEFHALSSGMKAVITNACTEGSEICRRACGGIGYLDVSGLPNLATGATAACTYEGDNTVLLLQTARYLMKICTNPENLQPSVQYIFQKSTLENNVTAAEEILNLFKQASAGFVQSVYKTLSTEIINGVKEAIAWSNNTLALEKSAYLHSQTFIMQWAYDSLRSISVSNSLRLVLEYLYELMGIYWILQNSKFFVMYGGCSGAKISELNLRILKLLALLRPNAVALVDAFDFHDFCLLSAIGCYDGKAYERVLDYWKSGSLVNVFGIQKKANL